MIESSTGLQKQITAPATRRLLVALLFTSLLGAILVLVSIRYYRYAINQPVSHQNQKSMIDFTISPGENTDSITQRLEKEGLVSSALLLKIYLRQTKLSIQAGEYQIPLGLSLVELVDLLQQGTFEEQLTFIEGWRLEQYANQHAAWKSPTGPPEFVRQTYYDFVNAAEGKEGYLFPDTYRITRGTTIEELIERMLQNTRNKLKDLKLPNGITQEQLVIFASLVEREAKFDADRPIVAGILLKRYREGMALEVDATVQYALATQRSLTQPFSYWSLDNWWPPAEEGLKLDSLYNTRKYAGLPPGPICNPGLASLQAVANYQKSPYWFYFSEPDGIMHYAATLEEHIDNIREFGN